MPFLAASGGRLRTSAITEHTRSNIRVARAVLGAERHVDEARGLIETAAPAGAMAEHSYVTTAESVTEGHPDKVADQISDAVLDAALFNDPGARVACEVLVTEGKAVVAAEV